MPVSHVLISKSVHSINESFNIIEFYVKLLDFFALDKKFLYTLKKLTFEIWGGDG